MGKLGGCSSQTSRSKAVVTAVGLLVISLCAFVPPVRASHNFPDVDDTSPIHDAVEFAVNHAGVTGINGSFNAAGQLTRAQAVNMLWTVSGAPTGYPPHGLSGVQGWVEQAVRWSVAEGVVEGINGDFESSSPAKRQQYIVWLWKLDGSPDGYSESGFSDDENLWYEPAVDWAVAEDIVVPTSSSFNGGTGVLRGDAVVWLYGWSQPRETEVTLEATLTSTNLVELQWKVSNSLYTVEDDADIEPNVGVEPAICDLADGCSTSFRTDLPDVTRYTITVHRAGGGVVQASAEANVARPGTPVVPAHRVNVSSLASQAQTLSWDPPPGAPTGQPTTTHFIRVTKPNAFTVAVTNQPLDGSYTIPTADRATAATGPLTWRIQYCRKPGATNDPVFCGAAAQVTFDPEPSQFTGGDYRRFVTSGTALTLNWTSGPGDHWLLDAPSLGVNNAQLSSATYTVPAGSVAAGVHNISLRSCVGVCPTNDASEPARLQVVAGLTSQRPNWTMRDITDDFTVERVDEMTRRSIGAPLDVTFGDTDDVWAIGEFGTDLAHVDISDFANTGSDDLTHLETPYARRIVNDVRLRVRPFGNPLGACASPSEVSALAERVIWTGEAVWFTQGGADTGSCGGRNHSRLIRFDPASVNDPSTDGDDRFCAVHVPGNNNDIIGIAYDPGADRIWFTEPSPGNGGLSWFDESDLGSSIGCDNSLDYEDGAAVSQAEAQNACSSPSDTHCIHRISLSSPSDFPAQLAIDEESGYVWFTDWVHSSLSRFPLSGSGSVQRFPLPGTFMPGQFFTVEWQIRATADAVYLIEYNDNQIVRFDTTVADLATACANLVSGQNPCAREVFLPMGSTTVRGHSIDIEDNQLWFTMANESRGVTSDDHAYFGYLDLDTWTTSSAPDGVIYQDLNSLGPPPDSDHRAPRGIDVDSLGRVALAEMGKEIVLLAPN